MTRGDAGATLGRPPGKNHELLPGLSGQPEASAFLRGLVARDRFPGALIFTGPEGTGRLTAARVWARVASCDSRSACGACEPCRANDFGEGFQHIDVDRIFAEEKKKAEAFRDAISRETLSHRLRLRVVAISPADRLNAQMQAALLKSIEEPPDRVTWVLVAESPASLPATIRSRCLVVRFRPLPDADLRALLEAEGAGKISDETLRASGGSLAVARTFLESGASARKIEENLFALARVRGDRGQIQEKLKNLVPILARLKPKWKEALLDLDRQIAQDNANVALSFAVFADRVAADRIGR